MAGGAYLAFALGCGAAGGIIGRIKGSSFFIWFLVCLIFPPALVAAILYRFDTEEPETACPRCGKRTHFYDAICTRCGNELNPGYTDQSSSVAERPA
jgi:DNA-directed RNA polymerase subunit RPC12/RpoP